MSIPVAVDDLAAALAEVDAGYLLTASSEGRVKAVSVVVSLVDGCLLITAPGRGSSANVAVHDQVTLLYPPREPGGFTLLVDGTAEVDDDDVRVRPGHAVLHRPADHAPGSTSACGHDCHPVG